MSKFQGGLHHLTPYLTVNDADAFIDFVERVFGGVVIKENRYETGRVQHARICIGESVLMLNEANDDYPANTSQMHLFDEDAGQCHAHAISAGSTNIMDLNIRPHGDQMAGIKDPFGNVRWLATPVT